MLNKRLSGILMPIFSLPNNEFIGTLGNSAYEFIDFLSETNQHYWQMLPIGMTSYGDSPYQSFSSYAGNPYFIDLHMLTCKGWLENEDLTNIKKYTHIDYEVLWQEKYPLLRKAYEKSAFNDFQAKEALAKYWWLDDFSTFMGLKSHFNFRSRLEWDDANFKSLLTDELFAQIQDEKRFHIFIQMEFFEQWFSLKEYADFKGIELIGDIPIFVSEDSADLW
ncbi:MAG: 4-alpha-glucanotransferase, partial [Brevinema sp.]